MRELARFLPQTRIIDNDIVSSRDCITPNKLKAVVEGVNRVAGYEGLTQVYSIPSLALKTGHKLRRCA